MKNNNLFKTIGLIAIIFTFACSADDDTKTKNTSQGTILIASTIVNSDGMSGSAYMQMIPDLSPKTCTNKKAVPITYMIKPQVINKQIWELGSLYNIINKYKTEGINLIKDKELNTGENSAPVAIAIENTNKAYISLMSKPEILIINPQSLKIIDKIDISKYAVGDKCPDAGAMIIRDGKLFVGLNQMVGGFFAAKDRPYSDVLIIDCKTNKVIKMISEKKSGISTATRPVDPNSIFIDENNDIYIICIAAWGAYSNHKAGILRIKSGETEFDPTYKFYLGETPIFGDPNTLSYIAWSKYSEQGKLYALAEIPAYKESKYASMPLEIDLRNKTIKKLDLPRNRSKGSVGSVSLYKDEIVFGLSTKEEDGFYIYNPKTGKASNKAIVKTTGDPTCFYYLGEN